MDFTGWPPSALDFFKGLEANNTKAYWIAHKLDYTEYVLAPMQGLLDHLETEFGTGKIFRPYRDLRFTEDKSPYKTAIGAILDSGCYVQFSAKGLAAGAGYHELAPDQLRQFREAVAGDSGEELLRIIDELEQQHIEVSAHETLKTTPRGYPIHHPRANLLRMKGVTAWRSWGVEGWVHSAAALEHVQDFFRTTRPLVGWLESRVGATALS